MHMLNRLKNIFVKPRLSREAFIAYYNRLPETVEVSWFRDGKYIIGTIMTGKHTFMTQGRSADEFIEMVNDAVITVCDVPDAYVDTLRKAKTFVPSQGVLEKLTNGNVASSKFALAKQEGKVLQLA